MRLALRFTLLTTAALAGCTTYDLEPVQPFALANNTTTRLIVVRSPTPQVLFLLDTSGSMDTPINPADPACAPGCGPSSPCAATCRTRISELRAAVDDLLTGPTNTSALWGLATFPADVSCGGPSTAQVGFSSDAVIISPDELRASAAAVNARVQSLRPTGGTPTAAALRFAGSLFRVEDNHPHLVVLITDGLPNCNDTNANNVCSAPNAVCRCTTSNCAGALCAVGCLDEDAAVAAARELQLQRGVPTAVVGFGGDLGTGDASRVLQAMAVAGNFPRRCPNGTDAECGPGSRCQPNGQCDRLYYTASDAQGLRDIFREIILPPDVCTFSVDPRPAAAPLLVVRVNEQRVEPGADTWSYSETAGTLSLQGALCDQLKQSTPVTPFRLDVSVLEAY